MTTQRYIDIGEDEPTHQTPEQPLKGRRVDDILKEFAKEGQEFIESPAPRSTPPTSRAAASSVPTAGAQEEVLSLRKEVESLRELLNQFGREKTATRHPGAEYGLPFELSAAFEKLQAAGVDIRYAVEILEKANEELNPMEKKRPGMTDAWVARYMLAHTSVAGGWIKPGAKIHLFVGPGGHGKTTALVKMAGELVLGQKKKVAVITTDTFKVGAADQLKIYCQILALPFESVKTSSAFAGVLQKYAGYDAILVDYPGLSLKDMPEIDQIRALIPDRSFPKQTHLVLNCLCKDVDAYEICHRYQVTHYDDILVTKVDESYVHGFLYNVQRKTEKPLYAFGLGQKIPEDIELATRERVIDLIFKITKNKK